MKALAVLVACLLFTVPAQAFGPGGGHHPGFGHGGGHHPGLGHGPHHGHGHYGLGFGGGGAVPQYFVPDYSVPERPDPVVESNFPPPGVIAATIAAAVALAAAAPPHGELRREVAAPGRRSGPHIIYIGPRPTISGPRVIYGSD